MAVVGSIALLLVALSVPACSRTGVGLSSPDAGPDAGSVPRDAGADAGVDSAVVPRGCEPAPEECNGRDDDCDGMVDEVPPVPCEGGGTRLCVAGRLSECPRRCEHCVPGSERVCFLSYCTYWGVQTCAADGRGFGECREQRAPDACISIALDRMSSPELEQCCIDGGWCCRDRHDLDADGDRGESLGACEDVLCEP